MKILIVESDPSACQALRSQLRQAGYETLLAASGAEAVDTWRHDGIRLVIAGLPLPDMEAAELLHQLRQSGDHGYTYLIFIASAQPAGSAELGEDGSSGSDDVLVRPFDPRELAARVLIGERILDLEARLSQAYAQMEHLATCDSLTGLLNRRAVHNHIEIELSRAARLGAPLGLVLLELDHFKRVNDRHGQGVGDQALKLVAEVLQINKRPYDWAGRWAGSEFILLLPGANLVQAGTAAERMRAVLNSSRLNLSGGDQLSVRASWGVAATLPGQVITQDDLLKQASYALSLAKEQGRDCVVMYPL